MVLVSTRRMISWIIYRPITLPSSTISASSYFREDRLGSDLRRRSLLMNQASKNLLYQEWDQNRSQTFFAKISTGMIESFQQTSKFLSQAMRLPVSLLSTLKLPRLSNLARVSILPKKFSLCKMINSGLASMDNKMANLSLKLESSLCLRAVLWPKKTMKILIVI